MHMWLLLVAVGLPVFLVLGTVLLWRRVLARDNRRSPLTISLHHQAGEQLRRSLDRATDDFYEAMGMAVALGPLFLSGWMLARLGKLDWSKIRFGWGDVILGLAAAAMLAWIIRKVIINGQTVRKLRQGLEAELATAQCLTPLIGEGCYVLHDIPADKFNIDHVVISPHAVFAVESKSRMKPEQGGKENARVRYDGKTLRFPEHVETKPLDQAKGQARWLQKALTDALGEPVKVVPVLSLPGWFVEGRGGREDVVVCNPVNPRFMLLPAFGDPLPEALRKRVLNELTKRYPGQG